MFLRQYKEKWYFSGHGPECVFVNHLSLVMRESQFDILCGLRQSTVYMSNIFRRYIRKKYVYQYPILTASCVNLPFQVRTSITFSLPIIENKKLRPAGRTIITKLAENDKKSWHVRKHTHLLTHIWLLAANSHSLSFRSKRFPRLRVQRQSVLFVKPDSVGLIEKQTPKPVSFAERN